MNVSYRCPECGAALPWSAIDGCFRCEFCDGRYTAEEVRTINGEALTDESSATRQHAVEVTDEEAQYLKTDDGTEGSQFVKYRCAHCQAELVTEKSTAATTCVYCGHPVVMAEQLVGDFTPKYVIPFVKTKEDASAAFDKFMNKPLTPKNFKELVTIDKIQGIYIPFWLFSGIYKIEGRFESMNCSAQLKTGMQMVKRSWKVFDSYRKADVIFEYVPADGSSKTDDAAMESIEPYDFSALTPFNAAYLSGYLAERYDETSEQQKEKFQKRLKNTAHDALIKTCDFDRVNTVRFATKIKYKAIDYVLLPTWLLYCTYKGKRYLFAMNGQTGKFIGNLPISWGKAAAIWSGLFAVLALLFWFIL